MAEKRIRKKPWKDLGMTYFDWCLMRERERKAKNPTLRERLGPALYAPIEQEPIPMPQEDIKAILNWFTNGARTRQVWPPVQASATERPRRNLAVDRLEETEGGCDIYWLARA
ncbi:hypothetical protein CHELA1G11_70005 [Hyphomicrobiales bacterium]|jgi:hypothetical protein|nr:hypothetical protein CHELA1G2_60048 [Hyphomicrobiales bacterium]CAH1696899.1 hypothetical protein CHELA1G11_70005 [Hyphomicrobiales bacterium]